MTPLDYLIAALVQLEEQAQEIEHRQSFIRSAIESFGVDADDALLVAVRGKDVAPHASATAEWMGRNVGFDLSPAATVEPDSEVVDQLAVALGVLGGHEGVQVGELGGGGRVDEAQRAVRGLLVRLDCREDGLLEGVGDQEHLQAYILSKSAADLQSDCYETDLHEHKPCRR